MKLRSPITTGVMLAALAALSFGVSTPLIQAFGRDLGPFATAALLYTGAAACAVFLRKGAKLEAQLRVRNLPRLAVVSVCGAFVAPVALAWGLQRVSGTTASLLLNLEAVFTFFLGVAFYREHVGRRVLMAAGFIILGSVLLTQGNLTAGHATALGLGAIGLATLAWAFDNTFSRPLADLDPGTVVAGKGLLGAGLSLLLAFVSREQPPALRQIIGLLVCGGIGYGLSLRFYLLAQRRLGAARTGSVFAIAPFVGALLAWFMGQPFAGMSGVAAALLMIIGVYLHLTERHGHLHRHEEVEHTHAHRHDDGHHEHSHGSIVEGVHSHPHRHPRSEHSHPHGPDIHHSHEH